MRLALRLLRNEPVELRCRAQLGVTEIFRLEQWREKAIVGAGIDASLKERKGDPVKAELDSAMKRIGELIMQVELLEAKTETSGTFGAAEVAAMTCRHLSRHGFGLRPPAGLCGLGVSARSSFYAMSSRQQATAEQLHQQMLGDRLALRSRTAGWAAGGHRGSTWRHPPGRARAPQGLGQVRLPGLSSTSAPCLATPASPGAPP